MTMQTVSAPKKSLPIFDAKPLHAPDGAPDGALGSADVDVEAELRAFEEAEKERLGIKAERRQWADNMLRSEMKKKEKDHVTLLISGLTAAQDFLAEGALRGLGYK